MNRDPFDNGEGPPKTLSIIIPVYNERHTLGKVLVLVAQSSSEAQQGDHYCR